jgi:phage FluMu protein Com
MLHVTLRKKCPHCKKGEMIYTGHSFTTNVTTWDHTCNLCHKADCYTFTYPRTFDEYERHEQEERWES